MSQHSLSGDKSLGNSQPSDAAVSLVHVGKSYQTSATDKLTVIADLSLDIKNGSLVAILGPSGCGKSTLLRIIMGLETSTGEVRMRDEIVRGPTTSVGIVFQRPALVPWRNLVDNVLLPIELLRKRRKDYYQKALELISMAGLGGFEKSHPHELSGGMQQRTSIIRALIHDPDILLLDEPFGALDEITREHMGIELLRIWEKTRKTMLFVTHSVPEAVFLSDRVVIFSSRPARVIADIGVSLPRPRGAGTRANPVFAELCEVARSKLGLYQEAVQ